MTQDRHLLKNWQVTANGWRISMRCPTYFASLLAGTLAGWSITNDEANAEPDVSISFYEDEYTISSKCYDIHFKQTDLISALNDTFICMAYHILTLVEGASLLHCAAYSINDQCNIVVGAKNTGKSTFIYEKARQGHRIAADDLLLWLPKRGLFKTLGLPIRMRRPVLKVDGELADNDKFYPGENIAYSKLRSFDVVDANTTFHLDRLWQLNDERTLRKVPLLRAFKVLRQYTISTPNIALT